MMKKTLVILSVIIEIICIWIMCNLMYNLGIFVDEYNLSPSIVYGGELWMYCNWLLLFLLIILFFLTSVQLVAAIKKSKWKQLFSI